MGRRAKKGRPVSGWLILDKDFDLGSTEAVARVKRLFDAQKVGHAGTLDPLATGALPIALGEATKTVPYVMEGEKLYRFTAKWGATTSTDDGEGETIATSEKRPSRAEIEVALPRFIGDISQVPPKFSAIKIGGERAYDLARAGEAVEIEARTVSIRSLRLVEIPDADSAVFEAATGKGAYVRALVRDLAKALGTEGHVGALRRLAVGPFHADEGMTLKALEALGSPEAREGTLLPVSAALADLPATEIGGPEAERLRRGQPAIITPASARGLRAGESGMLPAVLASLHGEAVALCELDGLKLRPVRVFN